MLPIPYEIIRVMNEDRLREATAARRAAAMPPVVRRRRGRRRVRSVSRRMAE